MNVRPAFTVAFLASLTWLSTTAVWEAAVPLGRDGYYYVAQVQALRAGEPLPYETAFSLGVRLMWLLGLPLESVELGNKAAVVALYGVLLCAGWRLAQSLCGSGAFALLAPAMMAISGARFYFISEFHSNLAGMSLLTLSAAIAFDPRRSPLTLIVAVLLCTSAIVAHKSVMVVCVAASVATLIGVLRSAPTPIRLGACAGGALVGLALSVVLRDPTLPVLSLWEGNVLAFPRWQFQGYSFAPEAVALWVLWLIASWSGWIHSPENERLRVSLLILSAILALNPWANYSTTLTSAAERLGLWSHILVAVLVPDAAKWIMARRQPCAGVASAALLALVTLCVTQPRPVVGASREYIVRREQLVTDLSVSGLPALGRGSVVVAEHGDQYAVSYLTGVNAVGSRNRTGHNTRVFWLLHDTTGSSVRTRAVWTSPSWLLVAEEDYVAWASGAGVGERRAIRRQNPLHGRRLPVPLK